MFKPFLVTAAILGAVAVILGAFGAHSLKEMVSPDTVAVFDTGVRYQFYHVFALFITGMLYYGGSVKMHHWAGICFIIGITLFSGSLYLMTALRAADQVGLKGVGIITPVGGLFFIAGWVLLAMGIRSGSIKR